MADQQLWCPSGQPGEPEAVVLGVRSGSSGGGLAYLDTPVPAPTAVELVPAGIDPTRVLRFASHCVRSCQHWQDNACSLVEKIVVAVPGTDEASVPRCHLRPRCRWWQQSGVAACHRCPLVETFVAADDTEQQRLSDPANRPADVALPVS
jgi:hypothetical protein